MMQLLSDSTTCNKVHHRQEHCQSLRRFRSLLRRNVLLDVWSNLEDKVDEGRLLVLDLHAEGAGYPGLLARSAR